MAYELLLCDRREKLAIVTLNRAEKRNALSIALRNEIDECLLELDADDTISAVVVTGAGPVFCAGFDTSEFAPDKMRAVEESSNRYHRRLAEFAKPMVAAVNGPAMGGGLDLAVLCDIRIAAELPSRTQIVRRAGALRAVARDHRRRPGLGAVPEAGIDARGASHRLR